VSAAVVTATAVVTVGAVALTSGGDDPTAAADPPESAPVATVEAAPTSTTTVPETTTTTAPTTTTAADATSTTAVPIPAPTPEGPGPVAAGGSSGGSPGGSGGSGGSGGGRGSVPDTTVDEAQQGGGGGGGAPPPPPPDPETTTTAPPTTAPPPPPPPTVAMPDIVGLPEDQAYQAVKSAQASLQPQGYYGYTFQKSCNGSTDPSKFGRVFAQTPAPGTPLTFHQPATANIYLACTVVPDVVGLAHSAASQAIYGANLQVVVNGRVPCQAGVNGSTVTNQDLAPGTIVSQSAVVNLVETAVNCP